MYIPSSFILFYSRICILVSPYHRVEGIPPSGRMYRLCVYVIVFFFFPFLHYFFHVCARLPACLLALSLPRIVLYFGDELRTLCTSRLQNKKLETHTQRVNVNPTLTHPMI